MVCAILSVKASCFKAKVVSSSNASNPSAYRIKTHRGRRRSRIKRKSKKKDGDDPVGVFCLGKVGTMAGFTVFCSKPGHYASSKHFIKCRSPPYVSDILIFQNSAMEVNT